MNQKDVKVKGFYLYFDQYGYIQQLSPIQKAELLDAMFIRFSGKEYQISDPVVQFAFNVFEVKFKENCKKYEEKCNKNRDKANKRWNATASHSMQQDAIAYSGMPQHTDAYNGMPQDANGCQWMPTMHNSNSNSNSNLKTERQKDTCPQEGQFIPPNPDEVDEYARRKGYDVDGEVFCDWYERHGWMQKDGSPVKNWKLCVVTWHRNEQRRNKAQASPTPKQKTLDEIIEEQFKKWG